MFVNYEGLPNLIYKYKANFHCFLSISQSKTILKQPIVLSGYSGIGTGTFYGCHWFEMIVIFIPVMHKYNIRLKTQLT